MNSSYIYKKINSMKRKHLHYLFLFLLGIAISTVRCIANVVVDLQVEYTNPNSLKGPISRIPPKRYSVEWDGNSITVPPIEGGCTFSVVDLNTNTVLCEMLIEDDITSYCIPCLYSGSFKICFEYDNMIYYGFLNVE
jgi:hypothetical protein